MSNTPGTALMTGTDTVTTPPKARMGTVDTAATRVTSTPVTNTTGTPATATTWPGSVGSSGST